MTQPLLAPGRLYRRPRSPSSTEPPECLTYQETNSTDIPWANILQKEYYESATAQGEIALDLPPILGTLCEAAQDQYFEDGMDSAFSIRLIQCIKQYGDYAINELAHLILNEVVDDEVASEALHQLGHIEHLASYKARLWLLEKSLLACSSAMVRDGALLGIALFDDRQAIPYLRRAIQQEQCPELRESIEQVLEQLESAY
jgi:hypothetical protein